MNTSARYYDPVVMFDRFPIFSTVREVSKIVVSFHCTLRKYLINLSQLSISKLVH